MKEYALYKGENILSIGTISEIADELGIKEETVRFYGSPSQKKRCKNGRILVTLDDDGEVI